MEREKTTKDSIGSIIMNRIEKLAVYTNEIRTSVQDKLSPIMSEETENSTSIASTSEQYPSYFNFLRDKINSIEDDLSAIKNMINRTEL